MGRGTVFFHHAKIAVAGDEMTEVEVEFGAVPELTADMVREQLEMLVRDPVFRSSKRSVAFLRYVVEKSLAGMADQIKERSIGIEVFNRDPAYDTNVDHVVRTAAAELRKRLATYYVDEKHRAELRIGFVPGSYVPRFTLPGQAKATEAGGEADPAETAFAGHSARIQFGPVPLSGERTRRKARWTLTALAACSLAAVAAVAVLAGWNLMHRPSPQDLFWKPVLDTPGPVLLVVGDHPNGPPTLPQAIQNGSPLVPVAGSDFSQTVPFADTVTVARVYGILTGRRKEVLIRPGNTSSFSDLREGAVVLIGAFNNEWSLRLTRGLRYSLAMDADRHLIYISDAKVPRSRRWSWGTDQPIQPLTGANSPKIQDFALISRVRDSETGHVVIVIGGLYTYGTQAAGEFLADPDLMRSAAQQARALGSAQVVQIVLGTTVTDGTPGPPRVLAVSAE